MNSKLNPKIIQEQAVLIAHASRIQTRASMFLASASLIQEYASLTQRLLNHINELNQSALTDGGTVPLTPQGEVPAGDSSSASGLSGTGDKAQRQPILG